MNLSPRNTCPQVNGVTHMLFTGHVVDTAGRLRSQLVQTLLEKPSKPEILLSDIEAITTGLSVLNDEQRKALKMLLEAERHHASNWWTYLNEMRLSGELPDWVKSQDIGTHPDYDRFDNDRKLLNLALFGSPDLYKRGSFRSVRIDL